MMTALIAGDLSAEPAERTGWRLLAHEILSVYQARKRRDAGEGASQ
jgi:hypothetical protein